MIKLTKIEVLWLKNLAEAKSQEFYMAKIQEEPNGQFLGFFQLQEENYTSLKNKLENVLKTKAKRIEIK